MTDQAIISRETIRRRAQRDHAAGIPLEQCLYHPWTPAYATHKAEYLRLDALAKNSARSHDAPAAGRGVELRQADEALAP